MTKPLKGIKVVSLAQNLPGPLVTQELQKLGAQVVKIEPPQGDPVKEFFPELYSYLIKGQKILTLDLKNKKDQLRLAKLLSQSDLLITSSRPSALKGLGLSQKILKSKFPKLSHVGIIGYGSPHEEKPGHDLTYQAKKGFVRPPDLPVTFWADIAGAQKVIAVCLTCLYQMKKTKRAAHTFVSLADALDLFNIPVKFKVTTPGAFLGGALARYNIYPTQNGWVAVAALEDHFWDKLKQELGLKTDEVSELKTRFLKRTATDWERWAEEKDLPIVAIRSFQGS